MADKNFKGGPGGRLKAAAANFNKPTTQDSLNIYNNAQKVFDYYKNKKYNIDSNHEIPTQLIDPFIELDNANKVWNNKIKNSNQNGTRLSDEDVVSTPSGPKKMKDITYRKDFDANRFMQRELANSILDTRAPAPLYDRRIKPTRDLYLKNKNKNDLLYNDGVMLYMYDPLLVKPVKMLTPEERKLRGLDINVKSIQPISTPKPQPKSIPVIKRTVSEDVEPMAPRQAAFPSIAPSEIVAPVMRPVDVPPAPPMREPVMEEEVVTERPLEKKEVFWRSKEGRKMPKAVMPRRAGGWSNQPLLMQLFPKLYQR